MISINRILRILVYASAIIGCLPVLPYLSRWVQFALLTGLVVGIVRDRSMRTFHGHFWGTVVVLGAASVLVVQLSRNNIVVPLIHILCLLLAARLGSEKSPRNMLQSFLLATTVLAASSLLTLNVLYLFYLVLMICLVSSGLVLLCFVTSEPNMHLMPSELRLLGQQIFLLPVGSLVLMCGLFFILPRTQMPLWNFLNPPTQSTIGMSDQIRPGSIAELSESGQTAFRAETDRLPDESLYWRGIVMNHLDGQTWKRSRPVAAEQLLSGSRSAQELIIYADPKADPYLVTLDRSSRISGIGHVQTADDVFVRKSTNGKKINYRVYAQPQARSRLLGISSGYLDVPETVSPRMYEVAQQINRDTTTYRDKVDSLETFFLHQQLSYSSKNLPVTEHPIETFLFESRRGYCEYFASSFAILLRMLNVPSRLVGGYLGGDYNEIGGFYLVMEDFAHVWVEALDDNGIWNRIDPSRLAVNAEQTLLLQRARELPMARVMTDAIFHYWSRTVLNYDFIQQVSLLKAATDKVFGFRSQSLPRKYLYLPAALLMLGVLIFRQLRRSSRRHLVHAYLRQVARSCGLKKLPESLGLFALAEQSGEPLCFQFAEIYGSALYTDRPLLNRDKRQLWKIISQLKKKQLSIDVALPPTLGDNIKSEVNCCR